MKERTYISMMIWVEVSRDFWVTLHLSCSPVPAVPKMGQWAAGMYYHVLTSSASQLLRLHYVYPLVFSHMAVFKNQR